MPPQSCRVLVDHGIQSTTTNSSPDHRQRSAQIAADQYRPLALVGHRKGRAKLTGFLDLLQRPRQRERDKVFFAWVAAAGDGGPLPCGEARLAFRLGRPAGPSRSGPERAPSSPRPLR